MGRLCTSGGGMLGIGWWWSGSLFMGSTYLALSSIGVRARSRWRRWHGVVGSGFWVRSWSSSSWCSGAAGLWGV